MLVGAVCLLAGVIAGVYAFVNVAPLKGEAEDEVRYVIDVSAQKYPKSAGTFKDVKSVNCEKVSPTYANMAAALRHDGKKIALCHATVEFDRGTATIAVVVVRRLDDARVWGIFAIRSSAGGAPRRTSSRERRAFLHSRRASLSIFPFAARGSASTTTRCVGFL